MIIVWSSQARSDLKAIRDFIGRESELQASRQIERIIARVEGTARMPSMGHPVHEFPDAELREVHEGRYRIIYVADQVELRVVTIVHMKQQVPPRLFRPR